MSGTVIRVIEDYMYDFSSLAASGQMSMTLAQRIDTSQYREGGLLVRLVKCDIQDPSTDDIQIAVANDPWDPFNGATLYFPPGDVASGSLNPNKTEPAAPPTDPYSMWFPLTAPFGGLLLVGLTGTRSGGSPGHTLEVQLNADLILKD
jgi:hypothetical protein